jgi:hypothetical protein
MDQNVANFNSLMWITTEKHRWIQKPNKSDGLTVCCGDVGLLKTDQDCDVPVCDCASLFAAGARLGDFWDDPIFVGKCYELGFSASNLSVDPSFLMTSVGLTWPELYDRSYEVGELAIELRSTGWPALKAAIRNHSVAIKEKGQYLSDEYPGVSAALDKWYGLKTGAITRAPTPPPTPPTPAPCLDVDTCSFGTVQMSYDPLENCSMCAMSSDQGNCPTEVYQEASANPSCFAMVPCGQCPEQDFGCVGPSTPYTNPSMIGKCACACSCYMDEYDDTLTNCDPPDWSSWPTR